MSLATKLVTLRKKKGLTQMDLAERLNVSRQAISRWEVGAAVPSTDNLKVLGDLYGVQIDYLLNDDVKETAFFGKAVDSDAVEQEDLPKRQNYKVVISCIMAFIIAIAVLIYVCADQNPENDVVVPIVDMEAEMEEEAPNGTFTLE